MPVCWTLCVKSIELHEQNHGHRCDSDKLRAALAARGHGHCFPGKSNRKRKVPFSRRRYKVRYRVEDFFRRLKRRACAATRRDKPALHFMSLLQFSAVIDWMR